MSSLVKMPTAAPSCHIFKDSSIHLLPQIPHTVYHHAIELPTVLLLNLSCRLLPPFDN
jgi:hypothetical protein